LKGAQWFNRRHALNTKPERKKRQGKQYLCKIDDSGFINGIYAS